MTKRAIFLIDGFNLYHSLIEPKYAQRLAKYKWLNLVKLSSYFLQSQDRLVGTYYFSAICPWSSDKATRHNTYIKALKNVGIEIILGRFKEVTRKCLGNCQRTYKTYEEKRTDVNIAIQLLSLAQQDKYDVAYLISADSDLIPAIEEIKIHFPLIRIVVITPFGRTANELKRAAHFGMKIKENHLASAQFDQTITLGDGSTITCPATWI